MQGVNFVIPVGLLLWWFLYPLFSAHTFSEKKFGSNLERKMYYGLKKRGYKPIQQAKCGKFSIDLALSRYRLAIECDGKLYHSSPEQRARDAKRDRFIRNHGWKSVLRFKEDDINNNLEACLDRIERWIKQNKRLGA
jgi:very-short-patch-repair endonuclease